MQMRTIHESDYTVTKKKYMMEIVKQTKNQQNKKSFHKIYQAHLTDWILCMMIYDRNELIRQNCLLLK